MMSRFVPAVAALAVVVASVGGCGDTDEPASVTTATSSTTTPRADRMVVDLVDCHQAGFPTPVDTSAATARLSDGQELYLDEQGQARFTLIAKDCDDIVVDGTSTGSGHFNTAWVRITGPDEQRAIGPAPQIIATATDYFHPVLFQTDNAEFADATVEFGVPMRLATSMSMDAAAPGPMTGSVEDGSADPPATYSWSMQNTNPLPEGTNGVVHVLEGADDRGQTLTYDIECLVDGGWYGNATSLAVDEDSELSDLVGTGYDGIGPSPNLSCTVTIARASA